MPQALQIHGLLLLTASILFFSQLLLKQGVRSTGPLSLTSLSQIGDLIQRIVSSPLLLLGYGLSGVSALLWLLVLSRYELSYATPIFSAIYYVLLLLGSATILHEEVVPLRWIGAVVVIIGIALISQSR
jgi:drug/metabolite transporter (DMT)-like permease